MTKELEFKVKEQAQLIKAQEQQIQTLKQAVKQLRAMIQTVDRKATRAGDLSRINGENITRIQKALNRDQ